METLITINKKNFLIKTKKDLFSDEFQNILAKSYYGPKQKRLERIYCSCKKPKGSRVRLYTIKRRNGKFYLGTYKYEAKYHKFECPFNTEGIESFISEGEEEILLFSEDILFKTESSKGKTRKDIFSSKNNLEDETKRKVLSFNHLIFILMDEAYSFAFNNLNKNIDRLSGNIKMPFIEDFMKAFYGKFLECKFKNTNTIKESLKKNNASFYIGIINYVDMKSNKNFVILKTNKGEFKVDRSIWEKASRYIKIKGNIVSPPYFYLTIKKDFVIRLFIYPIAKGKFFIPVESNVERKYVKTVIKPVYKPLTVAQIKRVLTKEIAKQFYKAVEPDVRPDFFIFDKNKITVVEVFHPDNLKDFTYKVRLDQKERMYRRLDKFFNYEMVEIK